jgi:glycosyltransferase involved in cell wall biosynthesis
MFSLSALSLHDPMSSPARADLLVSVVMPLHEDAAILAEVVKETSALLTAAYTHHEIVLVAETTDLATLKVAEVLLKELPCIRLLQLSRDFGRATAILAGLETSIGDYVVTLVPETDPPAQIVDMVSRCRELDGTVNGVDARGMSGGPLRLGLKKIFHSFMRRAMKVELLPGSTDFHVFSRRMVNALMQFREGARNLRLLTSTVGYRTAAFAYTPLSRTRRSSRKGFFEELNQGIEMIVAHSIHPLRWVSWLGLFAGALNLLYMLYAVAVYVFKKDVAPGWTTLSLQNGAMFFLIFSILAVLSEYVGRVLESAQGRPLYFIGDEKNSSVLLMETERRNIVEKSE